MSAEILFKRAQDFERGIPGIKVLEIFWLKIRVKSYCQNIYIFEFIFFGCHSENIHYLDFSFDFMESTQVSVSYIK